MNQPVSASRVMRQVGKLQSGTGKGVAQPGDVLRWGFSLPALASFQIAGFWVKSKRLLYGA